MRRPTCTPGAPRWPSPPPAAPRSARGSFENVFYRIVQGHADIGGIPGPLAQLVAAALSRDPRRRPTASWLASQAATPGLAAGPPMLTGAAQAATMAPGNGAKAITVPRRPTALNRRLAQRGPGQRRPGRRRCSPGVAAANGAAALAGLNRRAKTVLAKIVRAPTPGARSTTRPRSPSGRPGRRAVPAGPEHRRPLPGHAGWPAPAMPRADQAGRLRRRAAARAVPAAPGGRSRRARPGPAPTGPGRTGRRPGTRPARAMARLRPTPRPGRTRRVPRTVRPGLSRCRSWAWP